MSTRRARASASAQLSYAKLAREGLFERRHSPHPTNGSGASLLAWLHTAPESAAEHRLLEAAGGQDAEEGVRECLAAGARPGVQDEMGRTALHLCRSAAVARLLLAAKATQTVTDCFERTPLMSASERGDALVVGVLLETADLELLSARDSDGSNALMLAAKHNREALFRLLVGRYPARNINMTDLSGNACLHWAGYHGNTSMAEAILAVRGADVNCTNLDGATPLHWAAFWGHAALARCLIAHHAVGLTDEDGVHPSDLAAAKGFHALGRELDAISTG